MYNVSTRRVYLSMIWQAKRVVVWLLAAYYFISGHLADEHGLNLIIC